jgi:hypothetical protein
MHRQHRSTLNARYASTAASDGEIAGAPDAVSGGGEACCR